MSNSSKKRTWKREKSSRPKKVKKTKPGESKKLKCPVWVKSPATEHPQLTAVLERPFLSTVFFDPVYKCFGYPVPGRDRPHILGGLHKRMKTKFFNGVEMPRREFKKGTKPRRMGSSKGEGSKADKELERAIAAGAFTKRESDGPYSRAIWKHWASLGHVPIAAQLPVVIPAANLCTAGDYFTLCLSDNTLHLWELKTGWPIDCKKARIFEAPLDLVWDLPRNRWQLQVELTRFAYEKVKDGSFFNTRLQTLCVYGFFKQKLLPLRKETGMKIDACHVIHAWKERREGYHEYKTKVQVIDPAADLDPVNWPSRVDMNAVYAKL